MKYVLDGQRFVALTDNNTEAGEMTWSNAGESLIIIDHTFVDNVFADKELLMNLLLRVSLMPEKITKRLCLCVLLLKKNLIVIQNTKIFYIKNITKRMIIYMIVRFCFE